MSIASRIKEMINHTNNTYNKLENLGEDFSNTDKNIENISTTLQNVYDDWPKVISNDVTTVNINKTKSGRAQIDLKGNTDQFITTGIQLFNKDTVTLNSRIGSDGVPFSENGFFLTDYIPVKANTTYTGSTVFTNLYNRVAYYDSNKTYLSKNDGGDSYKFTTPTDTAFVRFGKQIVQLDTYMLVEGDYNTSDFPSYEPYSGGTASPSPDYPQDVRVVTGENTIKVVDKNLFDNTVERKNAYINDYTIGTTISYSNSNATYTFVKCCYLKAGNTYKLSWKQDSTPASANTRNSAIIDDNNKVVQAIYSTWDDNVTEKTIIPTQSGWLVLSTDINVIDIQIELGSTATTYIEHKEQDFPISLHSRNLFDKNNVTNNIRLDSSGNPHNDIYYCTSDYFEIKSNTVYSFNPLTESSALCVYDKNKNFVYRWLGGNITTATTPNGVYYARLAVLKTRTDEFQIEEGSTATSYQPYYNYELCKIGDYQDYIYKNNDNWYIKKKISKTILNGTEIWIFSTTKTITQVFLCNNGVPYIPKETNVFYSNYFIYQDGDAPKIALIDTNHDVYVAINKTLASGVDSFKAWLSTHNTSLYYVLKNEQDILITDSILISQLNALEKAKSYDNVTSVIQENNDLPFILDIKTLNKNM